LAEYQKLILLSRIWDRQGTGFRGGEEGEGGLKGNVAGSRRAALPWQEREEWWKTTEAGKGVGGNTMWVGGGMGQLGLCSTQHERSKRGEGGGAS